MEDTNEMQVECKQEEGLPLRGQEDIKTETCGPGKGERMCRALRWEGAWPVLSMERASLSKGQEAAGPESCRALGKQLDFILSGGKPLQGVRLGMAPSDFCFETAFAAVWRMDYMVGEKGHWEISTWLHPS